MTSITAMSRAASWSPGTSNRLLVGRDVLAYKEPLTEVVKPAGFGLASSDAMRNALEEAYAAARLEAQEGRHRFMHNGWDIRVSPAGEGGDGERTVHILDATGAELTSFTLTGDTRISVGTDGSPVIETGKSIYANGALTATDSGGVLIRVSGANVKTGDGLTSVLNLSEKSGVFAGGSGGMALYGSYVKSDILGGSGENTFAGVFTACTVSGGDGGNIFSGYFAQSVLDGGAATDLFSGTFLQQSLLSGNDGDDKFLGTYTNVTLRGGTGSNVFGYDAALKPADLLQGRMPGQFHNVEIEADQGDATMEGVFMNSSVTLGEGDHTLTGVFYQSEVANLGGDAAITAYFSRSSTFTGRNGNTNISVYTGEYNQLALGDGVNEIRFGAPPSNPVQFMGTTYDMSYMRWALPTSASSMIPPDWVDAGTLRKNSVAVGQGETTITTHTGDASHKLAYGPDTGAAQAAVPSMRSRDLPVGMPADISEDQDEDAKQREDARNGEAGVLSGWRREVGLSSAVEVTGPGGETLAMQQSERFRKLALRSYCTFSSQYNFS